MQLFMRLNWDGGRAAAGLTQAEAQIKRFTDGASKQFAGLRKHMGALSEFGGVSGITRLVGAYAGLQTAREAMSELAALDVFVPRSVEEIFAANPQCGLSDINQQRVARKIELRTQLQALAE